MSRQSFQDQRSALQQRLEQLRRQRELDNAAYELKRAQPGQPPARPADPPPRQSRLDSLRSQLPSAPATPPLPEPQPEPQPEPLVEPLVELSIRGARGVATVALGDRVEVLDDVGVLTEADSVLRHRDALKAIYLGERGTVVALHAAIVGRPAVELKFADGARHTFFEQCLAVGPATSSPAATATSTAARGPKRPQTSSSQPQAKTAAPAQAPAYVDTTVAAIEAAAAAPTLQPQWQLRRRGATRGAPTASTTTTLFHPSLGAGAPAGQHAAPSCGDELSPGPAPSGPALAPTALVRRDPPAALEVPAPLLLARTTHEQANVVGDPLRGEPSTPSTQLEVLVGDGPDGEVTAPSPVLCSQLPPCPALYRPRFPIGAGSLIPRPVPPVVAAPVLPASPRRLRTPTSRGAPSETPKASATRTPLRAKSPGVGRPLSPAPGAGPKAVAVRVYENGNYGDAVHDRVPYRTVTIRPTFKTLPSVLSLLTRELQWQSLGRRVEALYDAATGQELDTVASLTAGMHVVATSGDRMIPPPPTSVLHADLGLPTKPRPTPSKAGRPAPRAPSPQAARLLEELRDARRHM